MGSAGAGVSIMQCSLFALHMEIPSPASALPPTLQMDPKRFVGLESVADAVEWLQSGQSVGKVHVQIAQQLPTAAAAARSKL